MKKDASIQEIASYTAGIIDGEGAIMIRCKKYSDISPYYKGVNYQGHITATSTCYEVIEWLHVHFRGSIGEHKTTNRNKRAWRWYICSKSDIESFIRIIFPYLIIKRERGIILLNFISDDDKGNQEKYFNQMRDANKKGDPLNIIESEE